MEERKAKSTRRERGKRENLCSPFLFVLIAKNNCRRQTAYRLSGKKEIMLVRRGYGKHPSDERKKARSTRRERGKRENLCSPFLFVLLAKNIAAGKRLTASPAKKY